MPENAVSPAFLRPMWREGNRQSLFPSRLNKKAGFPAFLLTPYGTAVSTTSLHGPFSPVVFSQRAAMNSFFPRSFKSNESS